MCGDGRARRRLDKPSLSKLLEELQRLPTEEDLDSASPDDMMLPCEGLCSDPWICFFTSNLLRQWFGAELLSRYLFEAHPSISISTPGWSFETLFFRSFALVGVMGVEGSQRRCRLGSGSHCPSHIGTLLSSLSFLLPKPRTPD